MRRTRYRTPTPSRRLLRPPSRRQLCRAFAISSLLITAGCGAGAPLLHPAHGLAPGSVSGASGVSAHFAPPDAQDAMDEAGQLSSARRADDPQVLVDGAIAQTLSTPGLAPWFSVRAGLVQNTEGGLSYTGRRARADLRYVFEFDRTALSAGAGFTGIMPNIGADPPAEACDAPDYCPDPIVNDSYSEIPGFDGGSVSGWGLDLPLLWGFRSEPGLFALWAGVRARYEDMTGDFRFEAAAGPRTAHASGSRWVFQGVVGLAVGVKPVWALVELSPAFERMSGKVNLESTEYATEIEGFSFSPAVALMVAP